MYKILLYGYMLCSSGYILNKKRCSYALPLIGSFEVVKVEECSSNLVYILDYSTMHRVATFDICLMLLRLTPSALTNRKGGN